MTDFSILEDNKCFDYYFKVEKDLYYPSNNETNIFEEGKRQATVAFSKGCVARCTFCHRFEKGYRVSPVDDIINHMKMLKEKYNVKYISIGDENFGSYKDETIKLIREMKSLGFQWNVAARVHTVNLDVLKLWKENGCVAVGYGIESGSPTMLKVMEKKVSLEQNIKALKATYEAKIVLHLWKVPEKEL